MDAILCERLMQVSGLDCVRTRTCNIVCAGGHVPREKQMILQCTRERAHASEN